MRPRTRFEPVALLGYFDACMKATLRSCCFRWHFANAITGSTACMRARERRCVGFAHSVEDICERNLWTKCRNVQTGLSPRAAMRRRQGSPSGPRYCSVRGPPHGAESRPRALDVAAVRKRRLILVRQRLTRASSTDTEWVVTPHANGGVAHHRRRSQPSRWAGDKWHRKSSEPPDSTRKTPIASPRRDHFPGAGVRDTLSLLRAPSSAARLPWTRRLGFDRALCDRLPAQPGNDLIQQALPHTDEGVTLANAHVRRVILTDAGGAEGLV
jgi:hypothetical protein